MKSSFPMQSSSPLLSPPPSPQPAPPPLSTCSELDLSVTISPTPKEQHTHVRTRPPNGTKQSNVSQLKPRPPGLRIRKGGAKVCSEEAVVTATPEPHTTGTGETWPLQPIRGCNHASLKWAELPSEVSSLDPSGLKRAELNTTLALKAELQSIHGSEFNTQRAIQETLQRSERTKNLINIRATEETNVSRSQILFSSLVSVDVKEDQLISQALQERLLLVPPPCHGNAPMAGLSLFALMTCDVRREEPRPLEEGSPDQELHPQTHPRLSAFDLYRRRTNWEASS